MSNTVATIVEPEETEGLILVIEKSEQDSFSKGEKSPKLSI